MGGRVSLPDGSWKNSAKSYSFNEETGILSAQLFKKDGSVSESSTIATNGMVLENNDGTFKIVTKGHYPNMSSSSLFSGQLYSTVLPSGNWSLSSRNNELNDGVLSAELKKNDGTYTHSTIVVVDGCIVENNNGRFNIKLQNSQQYLNKSTTPLPMGSWCMSAKDTKIESASIFSNKYILSAKLKKCDGTYNQNTLTYYAHDIYENDDGNFKFVGNFENSFKFG